MGITLLLADDSITIQKVVGIIFANEVAHEDYKLFIVDNGNEVLEKAREARPDLLLIDALMPGKSGYEVCEEVRLDPTLKDIPILLLVGAFEPFDEVKAKSSGADDFITKPFESQSLIDKVKSLVATAGERTTAAISPVSEPVLEAPILPAAEERPQVEASAGLAGQFMGSIQLGGEFEQPAEAEKIATEVPMFEPVVTSVEKEPEPDGVILLSSGDVVEASPEDDPWGTFNEEITEGEPVAFGEIIDEEEPQSTADTVDVIEPFTFMDEEPEPAVVELTPVRDEGLASHEYQIPASEEQAISGEVPVSGGIAGFTSEVRPMETPQGVKIYLGEEPAEPETYAVAEQETEAVVMPESHEPEAAVQEDSVFHFAPDEALTPAEEAFKASEEAPSPFEISLEGEARTGLEIPEPVGAVQEDAAFRFAPEKDFTTAAETIAPPAETGVSTISPIEKEPAVSLTEEQLAAAITRVSREIIEKIAWDVVPDLAEMIIKEEIRKIKEGLKN